MFDKERTGFISRAELKNVLIGMGETMSEEDAENLLMEASVNSEQNIDYMAFVK